MVRCGGSGMSQWLGTFGAFWRRFILFKQDTSLARCCRVYNNTGHKAVQCVFLNGAEPDLTQRREGAETQRRPIRKAGRKEAMSKTVLYVAEVVMKLRDGAARARPDRRGKTSGDQYLWRWTEFCSESQLKPMRLLKREPPFACKLRKCPEI